MSRLPEQVARGRAWPPNPVQTESARRAWATRRGNEFNAAVRQLTGTRITPYTLPELQFAAHLIGDQLALHMPDDAEVLPRGYRVTRNGLGERAIALGDALFNPAYTSPPPNERALECLALDLRSAWLREVLEFTGVGSLDFGHVKTRRE